MKSCQKSIIWLLIQSLEVGSYANVDRNYLGIKLAVFSSVLIDPQSESCIFIYKIHSQKEKAVLRISIGYSVCEMRDLSNMIRLMPLAKISKQATSKTEVM